MGTIERAARTVAGLVLGAVTALVHLVVLVGAAPTLLVPVARHTVLGCAQQLARLERARVGALLGEVGTSDLDPAPPRALGYLFARVPAGLLGGAVLGLLATGVVVAVTMLWSWATTTPWALEPPPSTVITGTVVAYYAVPGAVLLYLAVAGTVGVARWERTLVLRLLAPSREERLAQRVAALATSRAEVVAAIDDERRRIERDLHDGVQQRVVALGMLLGRARRHPERSAELLEQAHEEAQRVLTELREVSWRVYPAALDNGGLAAALDSVAERAPLPVHIVCRLPAEPPAPVRAAAWFVICETVTNASKHSRASAVTVEVAEEDGCLRVSVHDDGCGGADPSGGGLSGLARRVAAADGTLTIDSPPGGPTAVTAELPCG